MGEKARRRAAFRSSHPLCCFCSAPTETEDHVPPRASFFERRWPDEHAFPACKPCNDKTRPSDQIFSFYVRMLGWDDDIRERDLDRSLKISRSVALNHPDCFPKALPQTKQHRLRLQHGIDYNAGRFVAIPKAAAAHIELLYRKLCMALYYKYTERIAPESHLIAVQLRFDARLMSNDELLSLFKLVRLTHRTIKSGRFNGQFIYSYDFNPELDLFAVAAKFGGAFCGMAAILPEGAEDTAGLGPFVRVEYALNLGPAYSE